VSAQIIDFTGITSLDLDPDRVLAKAQGQLKGVVVLGYDQDGEFYAASSYADGGDMLWLLEICKKKLLEVGT
jgi:hypothetical protein